MEASSFKKIIKIALSTGKTMLENGAETYRVEDTVQRMIESRGIEAVHVFVIPTGIMLSADHNGQTVTILERVSPQGIDLERIDRANLFSRQFTSGDWSLDYAEKTLQDLFNTPTFPKWLRISASGMGGGFFVLLFGGQFIEFILAYFASAATIFATDAIDSKHLNFFIKNMIGGFIATLFSVISVSLVTLIGLSATVNMVIIGPLMMLVPGVSLTNGIRDLISGELLAGSAKIMEALFIAIALAFGVGVVLQFSLKLL